MDYRELMKDKKRIVVKIGSSSCSTRRPGTSITRSLKSLSESFVISATGARMWF